MNSNIFVCFTGIDGSGKSTLSKNIFNEILNKNGKVKYTWGRYVPYITKIIMVIGRKLFLNNNSDMMKNYQSYLEEKRSSMKKFSFFTKLYLNLIILEYFFEILLKIVIPFKLGNSIIADRYIHDTIINDICLDANYSPNDVNGLIKKFWNIFPKPDLTFYIQIPSKVAYSRKKEDIPSIEFLKIRNEFYEQLTTHKDIITLNGTYDEEKIKNQAMEIINQIYNSS